MLEWILAGLAFILWMLGPTLKLISYARNGHPLSHCPYVAVPPEKDEE